VPWLLFLIATKYEKLADRQNAYLVVKTSKCCRHGEIPVAMSLKSEKLSLLTDVLPQLSSAKCSDSCLVLVLTLFALVVNRCIQKKREQTMA